MTRSFDGTPIDTVWLEDLCASALWAPTAGNAAGVRLNVVTAKDIDAFFEAATDPSWRESSSRYEGLRRAGAVFVEEIEEVPTGARAIFSAVLRSPPPAALPIASRESVTFAIALTTTTGRSARRP